MTRQRALVLMVLCLLVAGALRFPNLTEVPPGPHYDEAANGILAADIGVRGELPVFIASYTGKEVLFFYIVGALMRVLGESLFTLRLASALLGLLTVASTYWLGRELLADRRVALLAAALLAFSFWHLLFSRLGFRAISQPLLQALAVAALFRGLKRQAWLWLGVAGIFLGLTAYTYLAARVFPLPLALALLPLLSGQRWRERFAQMALFLGTALLVLAPLLFYFYRHPAAFWVRIGQVAPDAATPTLWESFLRSLGMFFLVGDPYWRFNVPGQPLFNWFWGGLLVVGWLVALWRWRDWWYDWQKAAVLLLLLIPFFMILPTALAIGEIVPSNLRAIGLIPFVFYLPALGLVTLLETLADRFRGQDEQGAIFLRALSLLERYDVNYTFVILFVLLLGSAFTARQYFETWAESSELFYESDADLALVADFLDSVAATEHIYISARHYRHPTVAFLSDHYDQVKWLLNSKALALPVSGDALYVYPRSSPRPPWATPYLREAERMSGPAGPDGQPAFTAYLMAAPVATVQDTIPQNLDANFENIVRLNGYRLEEAESGTSIPLFLSWQVAGEPAAAIRPFVHLEDSWGNRWSLATADAYPAEQWVGGEKIIQRVEVLVPAGTPPGNYRLQVGLFDPVTGERLDLLDEEGRYGGDSIFIEDVLILPGSPPEVLPEAPEGSVETVRPGLRLLGYAQGNEPVATGATLPLALWWYAEEPQPALSVRLVLTRADNTGVILLNTQPVHETYPFQRWTAPQFVIDEINPRIPVDLEAGTYRLELRLFAEGRESIFATGLDPVAIVATERSFTLPALRYPLSAAFSGEIALAGYDLEQISATEYRLTLAWQALHAPTEDYTVFVHLLEQDGICCVWQEDRMPQPVAVGDPYPTGRWLQGEVVTDTYTITLPPETPPGSYPVEVGLYQAETGRRLQVTVPGQQVSDVVYLQPLQVER